MARHGLGKGLEALIPAESDSGSASVIEVDPRELLPGPYQPRKSFSEEKIDELAASMREHGVIQPLIVRRKGTRYELIAGERRLRAALKADLKKVPIIVKEMDDREAMEASLVENVQREDLNPVDEAEAYQRLISEFGLTQEEVAARVGKSRAEVANTVRLVKLEPEVKELLAQGKISAGHGRALVGLPAKEQIRMARMIVTKGLSVRKVEEMLARKKPAGKGADKAGVVRVSEAERVLSDCLGSPVVVRKGPRKGSIVITFFGDEDLQRLLETIEKIGSLQ